MKLAVLSDIHGNLPALTAVADHIARWQPDHVIVNGDIVNRGPLPCECWRFIQEKEAQEGWQVNRGNHEEYVAAHGQPGGALSGPRFEMNYLSYWTYQRLTGETDKLLSLPDSVVLAGPDQSIVKIYHASIGGIRDGIWPFSADETVREQIGEETAVFVTGHIHQSFIRRVNGSLVVNAGSAGQHSYGESRATYAQLTWHSGGWQAEIARVPYDMAQTDLDFHSSGYLAEAGAVARLIYHEWRLAEPVLYAWIRPFQAGVLAGEIDLESSVAEFLTQSGIE